MTAVLIGKIVEEYDVVDPTKSPEAFFNYIDISSIDRHTKKIVSSQRILGKDAPSRARKLPREGDILLSTVRPNLNSVALVSLKGENLLCSTGFCVLRPKTHLVDPNYLFYYLRSPKFIGYAIKKSTGASYPAISDKVVLTHSIPLPSLDRQKHIGGTLKRIEGAIEKRRQSIALLDEFLKAVFVEMFGEPERNPKRWDVNPLGNNFKSTRYGTGSPPEYREIGVPFIRATNIKRGSIVNEGMKYISEADAAKIEKCKLKSGELLLVRSGVNAGDCALVPKEFTGAYAAYDLIIEMPYPDAVFYNYLINSSYGKRVLEPLTRRAAQPHLNSDQIKSLKVIDPPLAEKKKFMVVIENVQSLKNKMRISEAELQNLFGAVMQGVFG